MNISIWAVLSALVSVAAYIPYVRLLLQKKVKPNMVSWIVWGVIDAAMTVVTFAAGEYGVMALFAAFTLGTTVVLILSFKEAEDKFTRTDIFYLVLAIGGIILWRVSDNPNIAVASNMFAAVMGTIPTIKKSFVDPDSEDQVTWRLFWLGGMFNTIGIVNWTFIGAGPTVLIWFAQTCIVAGLILGHKRKNVQSVRS